MTGVAVVLARPLDSYPPVRHLAAHETARPCACGVDIVQRSGEDVVAVVAAHNAHPSHRAWRERRG
jgi:hypothetical protein